MDASSTESAEVASPADKHWWSITPQQTIERLGTSADQGLTAVEAAERANQFGRNELAEEPPISIWRRVFNQLNQLVVWILIAAAGISALIGDWIETAAILSIVLLNVAVGVLQEERAGRALAALRKLASPVVRAVRDGSLQTIQASALVPGDIVQLEAGDNIPADLRLLTSISCRVQEAALTGESTPVDKDANAILEATTPLGDRLNMAFMGTAVVAGRATAIVVGTGMTTELGHIAGMLHRFEAEQTPLQRRLEELGRVLIVVCLVIVGIVFALQIYRGGEFLEVLLVSISLAVASVPEGMPAVVTVTLAIGLQRMAKRNALIRSLPSVETLGAVTVICTDKTGTLTLNEMTVRKIVAGGQSYSVAGTGYAPTGEFRTDANSQRVVDPATQADLRQALLVGALCNDSALQPPTRDKENWTIIGDPTEGALLVAAQKAALDSSAEAEERIQEIPFDSERKAMSVIVRGPHGRPIMYTKGALEVLLPKCIAERHGNSINPISESRRRELVQVGSAMASEALRVLALAYRELDDQDVELPEERELIFAGLVGMIDPPRQEVIAAVGECVAAGIRPVMITGDHPETAMAIAREIGIAGEGERVLTGAALDDISDDQLTRDAPGVAVYARVSAKHKSRVVSAWKRNHQVVAMTGDGVNDAPAVKSADIGIAMGIAGSDVTKEAADMVLTDDNFASIVSAVREGRGIYDNIQKFVHYLLSCNASEALLMLIAALLGWPVPLGALHILWINLVTDGLPALALGMEPPERDVMQRAPRPKSEPVITIEHGLQIIAHGTLMAFTTAIAFWWVLRADPQRLALAQSVAFNIMAYMQLFYALSCRSPKATMPEIGVFTNKYLLGAIAASAMIQLLIAVTPIGQKTFGLDPDVVRLWPVILIAALIPVSLIECGKLLHRIARSASRNGKSVLR
ncbi:MAG TPA: cation-translocating P-type ATPase [Lacipirellula sp.]